MNEQEKEAYREEYKEAKEKGVPFFPDVIFKDAVIVLLVFLVLVALTIFVGAPLEARADPADTTYTPRPEWYFLFLFQLLKKFPGTLEILGVVVIPTVVVILLFALPFLDRSSARHFSKRPIVMITTAVLLVGIGYLTVQAFLEAPPPAQAQEGDQTAALYTENCAGCHGSASTIDTEVNLHEIIAQGRHEGMPAWSADLSTDEIDSLVGFILSPRGSELFTKTCGECHETTDLVASDPFELRNAIESVQEFSPHDELDLPDWKVELNAKERTDLLNFLIAPDGQHLFTVECASCHGSAVAFTGDVTELREIIRQGGLHLEMPPWRERLQPEQLDILAQYVVDPQSSSEGAALFDTYCTDCHGDRVPTAEDVELAYDTIAAGGAHQTMPVWGDVLTDEQLDALVEYTVSTARGTSIERGQELFAANCAACHGDFGEGGINPARPNDTIAPISSAEYLQTRDDATLRAIIAQGQPNFGMSPFGSVYGGPLDDEEIDALISFMRAWEENPPVELPIEVAGSTLALSGQEIYLDLCAQCHGLNGEGNIGPTLATQDFRAENTEEEIFTTINEGHEATAMIGWGEILTGEQIQEVIDFILQMDLIGEEPTETTTTEAPEAPSFANDIMPIFEDKCLVCHGSLGGWDGSSYETVMTTGDNAPVVIPEDPENSLLARKLLGTQSEGTIMPPGSPLRDDEIQLVLDWIAAGAPDN